MKKTRTPEEKSAYDKQYFKANVLRMMVTFNRKKPEDMVLYDWLASRNESMVSYIKRLIREDMERVN